MPCEYNEHNWKKIKDIDGSGEHFEYYLCTICDDEVTADQLDENGYLIDE